MIVRLTYFAVSADKVEAMRKMYNEESIPVLRSQKGNLDCKLLEPVNKDDDFISMTIWDSSEDADAYEKAGVYKRLVEQAKVHFKGNSVLKVYKAESIMEHA